MLATKKQPEPEQPAPATKARLQDGKMTTSLRIEPDLLAELKVLAVQKRVRVNDVIIEAIRNHLAMQKAA